MSSERAKNAVRIITEKYRNKKPVVLGKVLLEAGYSESTSKQPSRILETESYQEAIEPIVTQIEKERQRLLKSMTEKDLTKVKYEDAARSLDLLTKNAQLLSGKETERTGFNINVTQYEEPNDTPQLPATPVSTRDIKGNG